MANIQDYTSQITAGVLIILGILIMWLIYALDSIVTAFLIGLVVTLVVLTLLALLFRPVSPFWGWQIHDDW